MSRREKIIILFLILVAVGLGYWLGWMVPALLIMLFIIYGLIRAVSEQNGTW